MGDRPLRFEWECALRDSALPSAEKLVAFVIGTYMGADGEGARPSVVTVAAGAGMSERSARRRITALLEAGWLERVARGHRRWQGAPVASTYRATIPQPATGGHLTPLSTGQIEHHNRPSETSQPANGDAQPATGGPPPRPSEHEDHPPLDRRGRVVDLALLEHATRQVVAENDRSVRDPAAVARARIKAGKHRADLEALVGVMTRHSDIDDPIALLTAWHADLVADRRRREACSCANTWIWPEGATDPVRCPECFPVAVAL